MFKVGDSVLLKSGSPMLKVVHCVEDQYVCVWMHNKSLRCSTFKGAMLKEK